MRNKLLKNPRFWFGSGICSVVLLGAIFAPILAPYAIDHREILDRLCEPNSKHWFGCDVNGADVLTLMVYGARTSLYISLMTVLISLFIGTLVGLIAGYFRGKPELILMRLVDIVMAFPGILLALTLTTLMEPSLNSVVIAIAATGWTSVARLVRGQALSLRERDFVLASRALGASHGRLIFRHILPQVMTPLVIHATFSLSGVIIVEAGLSFLGFGAPESTPTWGAILGQSSQIELSLAPHLALVPGMAIFLLVMALNFLGDALRDWLDPKG